MRGICLFRHITAPLSSADITVTIMEEKKPDRRTEKTKRAIKKAFVSILAEKELNKVTVREISEKADINRATFYAHYLDVYDLYDKVEQEVLLEWSMLILRLEESAPDDFFCVLIDHIYDNRDVFEMAFSPKSPGELRIKLYKVLEGLFRQITAEKLDTDVRDDRLSYQIRYRAEGCIAVLCKWVTEGFKQPRDFIVRTISELDANTKSIM